MVVALPLAASAQIFDDFSDGEFHSNPKWIGDTSLFIVTPDLKLRSNGNASSETISLRTSSDRIVNQIWEFWVYCDFSPSTSNHAQIFLAADTNLQSPEGYFLKFGGESGYGDGIDLFHSDGNKNTRIIEGRDSLFGKEKNYARVRVERSFEGIWKLEVDTSKAGGTFLSMGTAFDTSSISSESFLIQFKHTSTRKDLFQFDELLIKNGPFQLKSARQNNSGKVLLEFSSSLSTNQPLPIGNFNLGKDNHLPVSVNIHPTRNNGLLLEFSESIPEGKHWVSVKNVWDNESNSIQIDSVELFIFERNISHRDISINEIFFDPNPQIGLPEGEFIELFNTSESTFQLSRLSIKLGSKSSYLPDIPIFPGEYLIICKKEFEEQYQFLGKAIGLEDFPTLVNSGGTIKLILSDTIIIDKASYSSSFFSDPAHSGGGFSLEQIDPFQNCSGAGNWDGSRSPEGGTPGKVNSIYLSNPSPNQNFLTDWKIYGERFLELGFSSAVDPDRIDYEEFKIYPHNKVLNSDISDSVFLNRIILTLENDLEKGRTFQLTWDSLFDCHGNTIEQPDLEFGIGVTPEFGDLVISEFMPITNSEEGFQNEFIEIYNASNTILDLKEIMISDGTSKMVFEEQIIFPESYLLISGAEDQLFPPEASMIISSNLPSLNNSGDTIILKSKSAQTLQFLTYSSEDFEDDPSGRSIELINPQAICKKETAWKLHIGEDFGTPGSRNEAWDPNWELPKLKVEHLYSLDSLLILKTNQSLDSAGSIELGRIKTNQNKELSNWWFSKKYHSMIFLNHEEAIDSLRMEDMETCFGHKTKTDWNTVIKPRKPITGDLIINEILFNPYSTGTDFVEIYNPKTYPVSLDGVKIGSREKSDPSQIEAFPIRTVPSFLRSNQYLALTNDTLALKNRFPFAPNENFIKLPSFPSLPDDFGNAFLIYQDSILDSVYYTEEMHFSLLDEVEGVSLERINPNLHSNDFDNWTSASSTSGYGTPGSMNSQNRTSSGNYDNVIINPQIFSPDGDGFQDRLEISIPATSKTSSVSIDVFDDRGVPVKRLVSNSVLGNKNVFYWDGLNEQNTRVTFGNYIVLVSINDPNGQPTKIKKIVGVGGFLK